MCNHCKDDIVCTFSLLCNCYRVCDWLHDVPWVWLMLDHFFEYTNLSMNITRWYYLVTSIDTTLQWILVFVSTAIGPTMEVMESTSLYVEHFFLVTIHSKTASNLFAVSKHVHSQSSLPLDSPIHSFVGCLARVVPHHFLWLDLLHLQGLPLILASTCCKAIFRSSLGPSRRDLAGCQRISIHIFYRRDLENGGTVHMKCEK